MSHAQREHLRICVLGLGGGGFHRQVEEILRQVNRPVEVVLIFGAPHGGLENWGLDHRTVKATYVVRSPTLWGDGRLKTAFHGFLNVVSAWRILRQERPDLVLGVGTSQAIPFGFVGRVLSIPVWFVESLTRVTQPSLTGRSLYRFRLCSRFFYYWPELASYYPSATCILKHDLRHGRHSSFR